MTHIRSLGATRPDKTISSRCPRRGPRRGLAVLAGGVIALGAAAPVAAGQFEKGHFHDFGEEVIEGFCGLDEVVHTFDFSGSFTGTAQRDGLIHFRDHTLGTQSFTNPETGKSYSEAFTFSGHDLSVTDNGDGTLTIIFQGSGTDSWFDGDGKRVLSVSGMFRDELLIDNNGTPSDPSDDEFLEFVGNVKPYQHNPFIGRDFCEDFFLFTS